MQNRFLRTTSVGAAALLCSAAALGQPCEPYWARPLNLPVPGNTVDMTRFDDGSGPAMFMTLRHDEYGHVVRWRGGEWEVVDSGIPSWNTMSSPRVLNDGGGPALYIRARLWSGQHWFGRWDGEQWHHVFPGMQSAWPAVSVDVGDGMKIYGIWNSPSGWTIVRWDEGSWSIIGVGIVHLFAFDLGDGPGLYAFGRMQVGGGYVDGLTRWTGSEWLDLTSPGFSTVAGIGSLETVVFDDGTGPTIYTTTPMNRAGEPITGLRRWLGPGPEGGWELVGTTITGPNVFLYYTGLHVFDDGRGPALYLTGNFNNINGMPARGIARYDGQTWEAVEPGLPGGRVRAMGSIQTPRGPTLLISGNFSEAAGGLSPWMVQLIGCPNCYANCTGSTTEPRLTIDDFMCFINKFASRDPYANCTGATAEPFFNVDDFLCFMQRFAQGCP